MTEETPPLNPTLYMGPEIGLSEEMSQSFMDYAMSVIVSRALPDVRDGLKPVQRRIIYSMSQANLVPSGRHRKCATVVGDVMARFHPHGDQAIYDALVRLGQDFSLGHPLVDPQGNFGSVEDPPGQMRYTECRLSEIAMSMLEGIAEDTVDFVENYDGEHREPVVLPSRYPNLLVNGAQGIAVGMATNIPPHNLGEVIDACVYLLDNPDCPPADLLRYVRGAGFPLRGRDRGRRRGEGGADHRPGLDQDESGCRAHRDPAGAHGHSGHRASIPGLPGPGVEEDRRPGQPEGDRRYRRSP